MRSSLLVLLLCSLFLPSREEFSSKSFKLTVVARVADQPVRNFSAEKPCEQEKAVGSCSQDLIRYYYDASTDTCQRFSYSGCGGNANRFLRRIQCRNKCVKRRFLRLKNNPFGTQMIAEQESGDKIFDECAHCDSQVGECREGRCHCRPGFEKIDVDECESGAATCPFGSTCKNTVGSFRCECPVGTSGEAGNCQSTSDVCFDEYDVHYEEDCDNENWQIRYFFNRSTSSCRPFWYGGCPMRESRNFFNDLQSCQAMCAKHLKTSSPVSPHLSTATTFTSSTLTTSHHTTTTSTHSPHEEIVEENGSGEAKENGNGNDRTEEEEALERFRIMTEQLIEQEKQRAKLASAITSTTQQIVTKKEEGKEDEEMDHHKTHQYTEFEVAVGDSQPSHFTEAVPPHVEKIIPTASAHDPLKLLSEPSQAAASRETQPPEWSASETNRLLEESHTISGLDFSSPIRHSLDVSGGSTVSVPLPTQSIRHSLEIGGESTVSVPDNSEKEMYEKTLREELEDLKRDEAERKWEEQWGMEEPVDAFGQPIYRQRPTGAPGETTKYRLPWEPLTTTRTTLSTKSTTAATAMEEITTTSVTTTDEGSTMWSWRELPPLPDTFEEWHKNLQVVDNPSRESFVLEDPYSTPTTSSVPTPSPPQTTSIQSATWPNWQLETWATPPIQPKTTTRKLTTISTEAETTTATTLFFLAEKKWDVWAATSHSSEEEMRTDASEETNEVVVDPPLEQQPLHKTQRPSLSSSSLSLGRLLLSSSSVVAFVVVLAF